MFVDGIEYFAGVFHWFDEKLWKLCDNVATYADESVSNVGEMKICV